MTTLVCTFIARGSPSSKARQGEELCFFTPAKHRKTEHGPDPQNMTHVLVETVGGVGGTSGAPADPPLASQWSLATHLFLDTRKDLKLVRRGKRIPWDKDIWIEAFLWRTEASYERGLAEEFELLDAAEQQREPIRDPESDPGTYESDLLHYRTVESKLGADAHLWEGLAISDDPDAMREEHVSTAFFSVVYPPALDIALGDLADAPLSASDTIKIVLDVFFELISQRYGRHAFKFWPPGHPPAGPATKTIPDSVYKFRVYAWFLDVVAYQFIKAKPVHATIVSSVFLRVLKPTQPKVSDPEVSLIDFEKSTLLEISRETAREDTSYGLLSKVAISRILERPNPGPRADAAAQAAWKLKRPLLHLVTLGFTPATFCVLRELVHYLLTISSHPYSSLTPGASTMSKDQEREWLNRPDLLRITIAESKPSCDGVYLARNIHGVVEASSERAKQLRDLSRSYADPNGIRPAPPSLLGSPRVPSHTSIPPGLLERLRIRKAGGTVVGGTYGTLGELLRKASETSTPDGATKVSVELIPDAALASTILAAGASVVVLVGAERVLPGDADVVAKMGAYVAAWAAKEVKAKTFVLATSDAIESSHRDKKPAMVDGAANSLADAWKDAGAANYEGLEDFVKKVLDGGNSSVKASFSESEIVPAKFIDAWITDTGILNAAGCCTLGKERGEAEKQLYGTS